MQLFKNLLLSILLTATAHAHSPFCSDILYLNLPIVAQTTDVTCGVACLDSVLRHWKRWSPGEMPLAYALGTNIKGTPSTALVLAARSYGLYAQEQFGGTIQDLRRYLANGETVYVGWLSGNVGHFSVVNGMGIDHLTLMDPWFAKTNPYSYNTLSFKEFLPNWSQGENRPGQIIRISNRPLLP